MDITIKNKNGIILKTANSHCSEDITVRIDGKENILPENIKKDAEILGIIGTLESGVGDITETEDYETCFELSRVILGEENSNPVQQSLLLNLEANIENVISSSGVTWKDNINLKSISIPNGSISSDYSVLFNGTNTYFDSGIPHSQLVNGYTVITRIKPYTWNNYKGIGGLHGGNPGKGLALWQYVDGTINCGNVDGTIAQIGTILTAEQIPINEWTILITTYDKATGYGISYIGKEEVDRAANYGSLTPLSNLIVGKAFDSPDRYFYGNMSHFMVYNRALSVNEVEQVVDYITSTIE